jgi:CHASE2 domain-containing sensor protein
MPDDDPQPCPQRELIEAFAHDKLDEVRRQEAETVLERSEPCRELFRQLTAGRYPRLPNYTIIGQVGKGGFGVVYKAIHHAKERTEALKVLFSKTPLLTEYFQNEVHLIARLRHPNIATLYDAQLSTPPLYYTMEFVEGERLSEYLKRGNVSLAERIGIIKSVAQAVSYAHTQGVVHRDLKPQNILLDHDGQARVVDFGISVKLAEVRAPEADAATSKGREGPVGTVGYIAPEQQKGGVVDERADIFSLGALLFHCVTGEPARLANVADQRIRILRERQVVQPEDLSAIIGRCVAQAPDDRYASCSDFVADLDNYLAGRMTMARENPSIPYLLFRGATLVMRDFPVTVRSAVLILVASLLTWYFWAMESSASGKRRLAERPADRTVMIGFTERTIEAVEQGRIGADLPELDIHDIRSPIRRMLYGQLLKRLAVTAPRVVLIDSYLTDCSEFDQHFIDGVKALSAPVVVGALRFDINGKPMMCETIREAVQNRCGTMIGVDPAKHRNRFEITHCIQRGFGPPIPGLALAAFAAWRYPDCEPELQLDADNYRLLVKYRKRDHQPGESLYRDMDTLGLHQIETCSGVGEAFGRLLRQDALQEDDRLANALVDARASSYWSSSFRTLDFEDVFAATPEQLRAWFNDRAIVIGLMRSDLPREFGDWHIRKNGERIFGCQIQAEAIDALLAYRSLHRLRPFGLAIRNVLWCGVGVVAVSLLGRRRWRSLRLTTLVCVTLFLAGLVQLGGWAALASTGEPWSLEVLMAATAMVTAGSLAFLTKAIREHQLGMTPLAATIVTEGPTLASTVLAETR